MLHSYLSSLCCRCHSAHDVGLLSCGLEAAMAKLGGCINELELDLLQSIAAGLCQQSAAQRDRTLLAARNGTLYRTAMSLRQQHHAYGLVSACRSSSYWLPQPSLLKVVYRTRCALACVCAAPITRGSTDALSGGSMLMGNNSHTSCLP